MMMGLWLWLKDVVEFSKTFFSNYTPEVPRVFCATQVCGVCLCFDCG